MTNCLQCARQRRHRAESTSYFRSDIYRNLRRVALLWSHLAATSAQLTSPCPCCDVVGELPRKCMRRLDSCPIATAKVVDHFFALACLMAGHPPGYRLRLAVIRVAHPVGNCSRTASRLLSALTGPSHWRRLCEFYETFTQSDLSAT